MRSVFLTICICLCAIGLLASTATIAQWYTNEKAHLTWNNPEEQLIYKVFMDTPDKLNPVLIHTTTQKSYTYIPNSDGNWVFGVQPSRPSTGQEGPICWSDSESCTQGSFYIKVQTHPNQGNRWRIVWK